MKLAETITINRSAQEVFRYYADFTRHHEFVALLERAEIKTSGDFGLHSEFVEHGEMIIGGTMAMLSKITRFDPPRRITCVSIDGGNEIEQDFEVEPIGDRRCKVVYKTKVTPPKRGLLGFASSALSPLLKSKVRSQMEKDLGRFKAILERNEDI